MTDERIKPTPWKPSQAYTDLIARSRDETTRPAAVSPMRRMLDSFRPQKPAATERPR